MCIYLGSAPELTYNKREHIFPAGMGGVNTLPQGWVSDRANALFSPLEGKLMHLSPVSLDRSLFGPGDRRGRPSKSNVTVGVEDDGKIVLSYLSLGKPYLIDQVYMRSGDAEVSANDDGSSGGDILERMRAALGKFSAGDRFVFLPSPDIPDGEILIGALNGKIYVACCGERPDGETVYAAIQKFLGGFAQGELKRDSRHVRQRHVLAENGEIARVYAKTAMNALAHLRGPEYVLRPAFDGIRRWVVSGENGEEFSYLPSISAARLTPAHALPEDAHCCLFLQVGGELRALVSFYGRYTRQFTLGAPAGSADFSFPEGYVCDWKNKEEFTLQEHMERLVGRRRDEIENIC